MSIDRLRAHWGFTRMPFSKDLAPSMLATTSAHGEGTSNQFFEAVTHWQPLPARP